MILAQELHFGRAAQRLAITQPALSQLVRDLESRLGFRVVERTTRKVLLTSAGRTFLPEADAILLRLDRAIETARTEAGHAANTIRIGAILPMAFEFLPAVLSRFRSRYPDADVHIENSQSEKLLRGVEAGTLHIALLRPPKSRGLLQMETLRREAFMAAMRSDHALARMDELSLRHLKKAKIVRISRGDLRDAFDGIDEELEAAGVDLDTSIAADTTLTAMALVSAGDGVSLVPSWASTLPWPGVCFREVHGLVTRIDLAVAWEAGHLPPIAEHFIELSRQHARERDADFKRPMRYS